MAIQAEALPIRPGPVNVAERIAGRDWDQIAGALHGHGHALLSGIFDHSECRRMTDCYDDDTLFRSRVLMARHGFGRGEYRYFAYPLPDAVQELRTALYPRLVPIANAWNASMNLDIRYPPVLTGFLARCHDAGQRRPTPLMLRYGPDDYNCLHQDLYGDHVFPLQATVLLSGPGRDFSGGEFLLTEQRPRMQSRGDVVALNQGDLVIFPVRQRPVQGVRRSYRVNLRHGVSRVRSGRRHTLGLIFHDAQ